MILVGLGFWIFRRMSLVEHIKHMIPQLHPEKGTPAWFTDVYFVSWIGVAILATFYVHHLPPSSASLFCIFLILQIVQANLYHQIWRVILLTDRNRPLVYSHVRNLFICILSVLQITWIFGLVFWWNRDQLDIAPDSVWQAIYFSFVTASTLGYGDIHPNASLNSSFVQFVVVCQIIVTLLMTTVALSQAISAVGSIRELQE